MQTIPRLNVTAQSSHIASHPPDAGGRARPRPRPAGERDGRCAHAYLEGGRDLGIPTVWSPRLSKASEVERQNYEIIGHGAGLHWPDLDEYVSVRFILLGRQSAVSVLL